MASATITADGGEIILRDAKPAFEWVCGHAVRKMSPKRRHAILQLTIGAMLVRWSAGRGIVGSEWRCRLAPWGEIRRPLVPDVSFVSNERFAMLETEDDRDAPPFAPDIVVEVLSRGERREYLEHKRDIYLACGTQLMLAVDPLQRTIECFEPGGRHVLLRGDEAVTSARFPDLAIPLAGLFAELDASGG